MKVLSLIAQPGEPRYSQSIQVNHWFWERGYDVIPFAPADLHSGTLDIYLHEEREESIFYGAVAIVRQALRRAQRPEPANLDFPDELKGFVGRFVGTATMGQVREMVSAGSERLPLHVKPLYRHKLFKGTVIHDFADLMIAAGVDDEEAVIVQERVRFVSEWRATILRRRVVNVAHYLGDPLRFPDPEIMSEAVEQFASQPIGFGMDWGVTDYGQTLLVEVNDGFALGNYGTRGHHYTALVECRWRELMGLSDNGVGWEA